MSLHENGVARLMATLMKMSEPEIDPFKPVDEAVEAMEAQRFIESSKRYEEALRNALPVGSIITWDENGSQNQGRITSVVFDNKTWLPTAYHVSLLRKDGTERRIKGRMAVGTIGVTKDGKFFHSRYQNIQPFEE